MTGTGGPFREVLQRTLTLAHLPERDHVGVPPHVVFAAIRWRLS